MLCNVRLDINIQLSLNYMSGGKHTIIAYLSIRPGSLAAGIVLWRHSRLTVIECKHLQRIVLIRNPESQTYNSGLLLK